jgi:hypothetical protein
MGALPATGGWVQLSVPASTVGLDGQTVSGMAFTLYNGRASFDHAGLSGSTSVSVTSQNTDQPWFVNAPPAGAQLSSDGGDSWTWAATNPAPFSGTLDLQSALASGEHENYFYGASAVLTVPAGETLYAYVYLDPANPPSEIMLQWNVGGSWEHRAYWGANDLSLGTNGTASRQSMGALPATGAWVRLTVPASLVGLDGQTVNGMAFTLYNGRAAWNDVGVSSSPQPLSADQVWFLNTLPAGAVPASDGGNDWIQSSANPTPYSGSLDYQTAIASGEHQDYFYTYSSMITVPSGSSLFIYVYLDPANPPSEVMLQWADTSGSWEHRAYWGADDIPWGAYGTAGRYSMGPLPATGGWVRLTVPASVVGLDGQTITGMAFTLYGGDAAWEDVGVTTEST